MATALVLYTATDQKINGLMDNISKKLGRKLEALKATQIHKTDTTMIQSNHPNEHKIKLIQLNNPKSAYASHIRKNNHELEPATNTMNLIQQCGKNKTLTFWENFFIQIYHNNNKLVQE